MDHQQILTDPEAPNLLTCTIFPSSSGISILDTSIKAPPQLAAAWFPPRHRATATAIGWSAQCIGVAIGYLIAPMLCPEPSDLPYVNPNPQNTHTTIFVSVVKSATHPDRVSRAHIPCHYTRDSVCSNTSTVYADVPVCIYFSKTMTLLSAFCYWL